MRLSFDSAKFGKCLAETQMLAGHTQILIRYKAHGVDKRVDYEISISGSRPVGQIPSGGEAEDAARLAINHFVTSSGSNHTTHKFACTERTARWPGALETDVGQFGFLG